MAALFVSSPTRAAAAWPPLPLLLSPDGSPALHEAFDWSAPSGESGSSGGSSADSGSDGSSSVASSSPLLLPPSPTSLPLSSPSQHPVFDSDDWRPSQAELIPWSWADAAVVHSVHPHSHAHAAEEEPTQRAADHPQEVVREQPVQLQPLAEGEQVDDEDGKGGLPSASSSSSINPRFYTRKVACQVCHFAKVRCDGGRPCTRCSRLQLTQHCADRPTIRRGPRDKKNTADSADVAHKRRLLSSSPSHQRWLGVSSEASPSRKRLAAPSPVPSLSPDFTLPTDFVIPVSSPVPRHLRPSQLLRVDTSTISSSLLASHFRTVTAYMRQSGFAFPQMKHPLREKLIQHTWFNAHMTPTDGQTIAHAFVQTRGGRWYEGYFDAPLASLIAAAVAKFAAADDGEEPPLSTIHPHSVSHEHHGGNQCDGRPCAGYCVYLRRLEHGVQCSFGWGDSPVVAIEDHPGLPSHAFLCFRHQPEEAAVAERQQLIVRQRAIAVARQLLAEAGVDDVSEGSLSPDSTDVPPLAIRVGIVAQVNAAFERLLGYSQAEVRASFAELGEKAMFALVKPTAWPELMDLTREAKMMRRSDFRMRCIAITRAQQEVPCVLSASYQRDGEGRVVTTFFSFLPLPDATDVARRAVVSGPQMGALRG